MRSPGSFPFIGFDNVEFAKASIPRLSIVAQPTKEIGSCVSELMLRRLDDAGAQEEGKRETVKLKTTFVEGKSVR